MKEWESDMALRFICPSCGNYSIDDQVKAIYRSKTDIHFNAACVAAERRLRKLDDYLIVIEESDEIKRPSITLERLAESFPKTATELLDRSLLNLGRMVTHPGDRIELTENSRFAFFSSEYQQMRYVLQQFENLDYISITEDNPVMSMSLYIQSKGWKQIEELTKITGEDSYQAFVAMWFHTSMDDVYDNAISPAIEDDCGIKPVKIDLKEFNEDVVDEIIAEIKQSRFVVADFTGGRQGVYFEAGFARGLGIPVIWLVQKDHLGDLHFDTRQFNHIVYEGPADLRKKLANRIKATVL